MYLQINWGVQSLVVYRAGWGNINAKETWIVLIAPRLPPFEGHFPRVRSTHIFFQTQTVLPVMELFLKSEERKGNFLHMSADCHVATRVAAREADGGGGSSVWLLSARPAPGEKQQGHSCFIISHFGHRIATAEFVPRLRALPNLSFVPCHVALLTKEIHLISFAPLRPPTWILSVQSSSS